MIVLRESVKLVNRINRADKSVSAEGRTSVSVQKNGAPLKLAALANCAQGRWGRCSAVGRKMFPDCSVPVNGLRKPTVCHYA